jgi:hypothetical protein
LRRENSLQKITVEHVHVHEGERDGQASNVARVRQRVRIPVARGPLPISIHPASALRGRDIGVLFCWFVGMLLVANLNEVRVFTEPIALMAPCVAFCLMGRVQNRVQNPLRVHLGSNKSAWRISISNAAYFEVLEKTAAADCPELSKQC